MNTLNYLVVAAALIMIGAFVSPNEIDGLERGEVHPGSINHMDLS